jgi:hypothetical protein
MEPITKKSNLIDLIFLTIVKQINQKTLRDVFKLRLAKMVEYVQVAE